MNASAESPTAPPNILVVDDTPANLQLLVGLLKDRGYKVRPVPDGELALRAAQSSPPDLILLDVTMPGLDGFEVCARLKSDERLRDIPVLFISALNDTTDKVRAFQVGGVDYVTKPFQFEEVEARVRTHLELRRKEKQLEESYARLRELERLRDSLTHMIVHDMRSPLLALQISCDLMRDFIGPARTDALPVVEAARESVASLVEMVNQMLDVSRAEAGKMEVRRSSVDLVALARECVDSLRALAGARRVSLGGVSSIVASVDRDLIRRVIANLLGNALKFTSAAGEVRLGVRRRGGEIRVEVADDGPGIAPEHHARIFEKFGQVDRDAARRGTGLGLTFCKMAVEAHGGAIGVASEPGRGSTFWFSLPDQPAA